MALEHGHKMAFVEPLNPLNTPLILWPIEMSWFHSWDRSQDTIVTISTIVLTGLLQQLPQLILAAFGL